jgi:hypothetical protein
MRTPASPGVAWLDAGTVTVRLACDRCASGACPAADCAAAPRVSATEATDAAISNRCHRDELRGETGGTFTGFIERPFKFGKDSEGERPGIDTNMHNFLLPGKSGQNSSWCESRYKNRRQLRVKEKPWSRGSEVESGACGTFEHCWRIKTSFAIGQKLSRPARKVKQIIGTGLSVKSANARRGLPLSSPRLEIVRWRNLVADQPAFSSSERERSLRSTMSLVISISRTRLLLGR